MEWDDVQEFINVLTLTLLSDCSFQIFEAFGNCCSTEHE